jgi:uncharacterized protein (TIGR00369 family)
MNDKAASPVTTTTQPGGFRKHVGYRTTVWRENYAEIVLDLEASHGNTHGALHGGVYMTVIDAAMGQAATWCPVEGHIRRCVTVSLSTSILAAARGPRIRAVARLESAAERVAVCRAEVIDHDGTVCATAQGTFRYIAGGENLAGVPGVRADRVEPEG